MNGFLEEIEAARGLAAVAQIGLGFTGFIAIVVALSGNPRDWAPIDRLRVASMLSGSLATMFFALLPFAVVHVGVAPEPTFRLASGLLAAFLVASAGYVFSRRERRDSYHVDARDRGGPGDGERQRRIRDGRDRHLLLRPDVAARRVRLPAGAAALRAADPWLGRAAAHGHPVVHGARPTRGLLGAVHGSGLRVVVDHRGAYPC